MASVPLACADLIAFNNFAPGMQYDPGLPAAAVGGPLSLDYTHAILFTSAASGGIVGFDVALVHTDNSNDFFFQIRADDNGTVGAVLGEWTNVQGFANLGDPPVHVAADGTVELVAGTSYWFLVAGAGDSRGNWQRTTLLDPGTRAWGRDNMTNWRYFGVDHRYAFRITVDDPFACYADCDGNTELNINDFLCFIDEFAQAQQLPTSQQITHYANCTGATAEPVLSVNDFLCFIDEFAQGCP